MKVNFPKSKWFIAFAITALIAIGAIVSTIVISVIANRPPENTEGDEMGVYYYDAEDGEVLLTLSTGNNFTISGPTLKINKTGTYTIEGNNLVFDFFKDDDGTANATLNGTLLELTMGQTKMNFLKKVKYTVTFNANGGSAVDAVNVVNGRAVAEPSAPTKENNVFLGWYADEALTTPFAFATTPIKTDITVYAKWAERTFGVEEYTVSFDLGYEATAPESIRTVSGKAHGVKAPERAGYTFGGWYVSDYNDATKLTFAYTEDTVFTSDTTLFAVWYEDGATKLNAPAVSITSSLISWSPVSGGNGRYAVTVTAPDGTVLVNETVASTVKAYDLSSLAAGEYVVSVVALSDNAENSSEAAVRHYANKTLDRVTGFQIVNGILVFNTVENAEKYIITIDCGNDGHVHTGFDNGNRNTYYIANCPMQKGGIVITVTAEGSGYASSTATYTYDLTLDSIAKVEYDAAKDLFIWEAVAGASEYIVTVKVGSNTYVINNGSSTTFCAAGFTGELTVSVVPSTVGFNSPDGTEATATKTAPAQPTGITVNGMVISWAPAAGASKYEVKIGNNTPITVSGATSLDLTTAGLTLTQGEFYDVQVRAISEANEASVYSDALDFGYFAMIDKLTYAKNTVSWAPVLGINTYKVRVNGGKEQTVTDSTSTRVVLTKEGENIIEVKYVTGESESEWISISVTAYAVEYDTRSTFFSFLIEYLAVGDEYLLPGADYDTGFAKTGYNFVAWANSPMGSASNGGILTEGSIFTGSGYTVLYATWTPKQYNVILNTDGYTNYISGITDGETHPVTYNAGYTLPVPQHTSKAFGFAGWYTRAYGEGVQMTDKNGVSLVPYDYARDIELYPHFTSEAVVFYRTSVNGISGYGVKAGAGIRTVSDIYIPETFNGEPVIAIEDDAFNSYETIITLTIPNTVQLIGQKAFRSALHLKSVEVYDVDLTQFEELLEPIYSSANGALIRRDMGTVYLECVPKAVGDLNDTGTFVIPDEVTAIKVEAFRYCNAKHIVIPDNVVEFPTSAFHHGTGLKTVTFLERTNPLNLERDTFFECRQIEAITFPSNLNMSEANLKDMLNNFPKLKAVNILEGNTNYHTLGGMLVSAEDDEILYCPKGYEGTITLPVSITKIGDSAFNGCTKLTDVTIPIWVTSIGKQAFYNATGITSVTFSGDRSEALTIGEYAFSGCNSIAGITFEANTLEASQRKGITVSANAFGGSSNSKLATVTVKAGTIISSIGKSAFAGQKLLSTFIIEDGATVKTIGSNAFNGCIAITSFKVPASVTRIYEYAFNGCTALDDLTFDMTTSEDAIAIDTYAFYGCIKLRSVILPDRLGSFNSAAFEGCTALKSITVNATNPMYKSENGILYKKSSADSDDFAELLFYPTALIIANNGIINNLPSTLVRIGGSAFSNNKGLYSITLPASISSIEDSAFKNCSNLEEVIFLGATATEGAATSLSIKQSAFENCTSLRNFTLPAFTTTIAQYALRNSGLVNLTIPAGVTSIGTQAFNGCKNLETVVFNNTTPIALPDGGLFVGCTSLRSVNMGAGVTSIGQSAFDGCASLTTVIIATENSKLTEIDNYAFRYCTKLTSITIPNTVTKIGDAAFSCDPTAPGTLSSITFQKDGAGTLTIGSSAFQNQSSLTRLDLPAGVKLTTTNLTESYTTANNPVANIFLGCSSLEQINIAEKNGVTNSYTTIDGVLYGDSNKLVIFCPAANVGRYDGTTPTYSIVIPTTVTRVMDGAFANLTKIKTITFEEFDSEDAEYATQILTIGHNAQTVFGGVSTSIIKVQLPSHLKEITGRSFAVTGITTTHMEIIFNMDAKKVNLADHAFERCIAKELNLPGIVLTSGYNKNNTTMPLAGNYAFAETPLLTKVTFASYSCEMWSSSSGGTKTQVLPQGIFKNAKALTTFTIPNVKTICSGAFSGCTALKSIDIPTTVTKIEGAAFERSGLTSITITGTSIGTGNYQGQFKDCVDLVSVTFKKNSSGSAVTTIPISCFSGCLKLTTVNFEAPTKLTTINAFAFFNCPSLKTFDFASLTALKTVNYNAFSYTSLTHIDLSKTKVSKLTAAFNHIATLKEFTYGPSMASNDTFKESYVSNYGLLSQGMPFENNVALEKITLNANFNPAAMLGSYVNGAYVSVFDYVFLNLPNCQLVVPDLSNYDKDEYGVYNDGYFIIWAPPSVDLDRYEIPEGIEGIETFAFAFSNIDTVVVSNTVAEIYEAAFYRANTTAIEFVDTIAKPSELTTIYDYAFAYSSLESIVIPDNVIVDTFVESDDQYPGYATGINGGASHWFSYCPNLRSITTGAKMKAIPDGFAIGTTSLEEIIMQPNTIEHIGSLFMDIYDFTGEDGYTLDLSNVPKLGHKMKHFTVPASVVSMAATFLGMDGLETVTFENGSKLMYIDMLTFTEASSLKSIENIPAGLKAIGEGAFMGASSLESIDLSKSKVEIIPEYAFDGASALKVVKLPATVVGIGNYAFRGAGIESIEITAAMTEIGFGAFENSGLKTLTIASDHSMTNLGEATDVLSPLTWNMLPAAGDDYNLFAGTTQLETVTIPNTITSIEVNTFKNSGIQTLMMSDPTADSSLSYISDSAFEGCSRLTSLSYIENPDSPEDMIVHSYLKNVTEIGEKAFFGCSSLQSVDFGPDLEYIGAMAFAFCTSLNEAFIPASVTELGGNPYAGLSADKISVDPFHSLFITETDENGILYLKDVDTGIIYGVWGATGEYEIKSGNQYSEYAAGALAGNAITKVAIPDKMVTIPAYMFMNCTQLSDVTIASGVQKIGKYAFYGTAITEVVLPDTLASESSTIESSIGEGAFGNCEQLVKLTINTNPASATSRFPTFESILAGSDNVVIHTNTISNTYFHLLPTLASRGYTELHVDTMDAENSIATLHKNVNFRSISADFKLYFETASYEDIIALFATATGSNSKWVFQLYDCNGNQLFCGDNGVIVLVTDAEGNTLWEA